MLVVGVGLPIDEGKLTAPAFASCKLPEYMHSRMVDGKLCALLYADPLVRQEALAEAMSTHPLTAVQSRGSPLLPIASLWNCFNHHAGVLASAERA